MNVRMRGPRSIRYDIMVVGCVLIIIALALYFQPVETTTLLPVSAFSHSHMSGWFYAGEIYLPSGDQLICRFSSDLPVTLGFATPSAWLAFNAGNSSSLALKSHGNGSYGRFSIMAANGEFLYIVGNWSPSSNPIFAVYITSLDAHGFLPYSIIAAAGGSSFIFVSLTYERIKEHLTRRI